MNVECVKAGDWVWVIERDGEGDPYGVTGYVFLAACLNSVIVSSGICFDYDISHLLNYHKTMTVENCGTELFVFPKEDCYRSRKEAEEAFERMVNNDD